MTSDTHVKELALRRFFAGELGDKERPAIEAHAAGCPRCRARIKELGDEQRRFEQDISFDRFAAGVERAARIPRRVPAQRRAIVRWAFPTLGLAAAMALAIAVGPLRRPEPTGANRVKGEAITVMIGGRGREARRTTVTDAPERLAPGERIRIGYRVLGQDYLVAVSIDDQGEVSPIYPESGASVALPGVKGDPTATIYLPDSVEFTGKGRERLIVLRSDRPLDVDAVKKAARAAFQKAGSDLAHLPALDLPGEQFQRTFVKP